MSKTNVEQMRLPLVSEDITIHCFFNCSHVVRSADPYEACRLMERHYSEKHSRQIDRIVGKLKGW